MSDLPKLDRININILVQLQKDGRSATCCLQSTKAAAGVAARLGVARAD
ncbi:MAG TPA: hypothetical protein VGA15_10370 [Bradyrhizobium sp.]